MAAKKKAVRKNKITTLSQLRASHKETAAITEQYNTLKATIQDYFTKLRYRRPEQHQIKLAAVVVEGDNKRPGMMNVATLIAAVLTAQGLGNEVRLEAEQNPQGGNLYVRFYQPITMSDGVKLGA